MFLEKRFNCCIFNHPCPIYCPFLNLSCRGGNRIVNPVLTNQFAFFNNLSVGAINSSTIIPLSFVQGEGNNISPSSTTGAVNLLAGIYEVTYFAQGNVPESGNLSIKLRLNGLDVDGSGISNVTTSNNVSTLTQTILISVKQTSILELVNNSSDTTTYTQASMFLRRI